MDKLAFVLVVVAILGAVSATQVQVSSRVLSPVPQEDPHAECVDCTYSHPVDCTTAGWSNWGECSAVCGDGFVERTRQITIPASNGGKPCGATVEVKNCTMPPCSKGCTVGSWSDWSKCSALCGGGNSQRTRTVSGDGCPPTIENSFCNSQPCPVDCSWSAWIQSGVCSADCEGRRMEYRIKSAEAAYGGAQCVGESQRFVACGTAKCPDTCTFGPWSDWDDCTQSCGNGGVQYRTRTQKTGVQGCGPVRESQPCNVVVCPVDCEVSTWTIWTPCDRSCGMGLSTRKRTVFVPAQNGGKVCTGLPRTQPAGDIMETKFCNTAACPIDCQVGAFSAWTPCPVTCGGSQQTRVRPVVISAKYGGKECPNLSETRVCNAQNCPIDCQVGQWNEWSYCTSECGGGQKQRYRNIVVPPQFGGLPCADITQLAACNTDPCPVHCEVGTWGTWEACSQTCTPYFGGEAGRQRRTRKITVPAEFNGKDCGCIAEERMCNTQLCPVDCELSTWSHWSDCSRSCSGGLSFRNRVVVKESRYGGKSCPKNLVEQRDCNSQTCPPGDCTYEAWSAWTDCDKSCGGGQHTRHRAFISGDAATCQTLDQKQECNVQCCPEDCVVSEWDYAAVQLAPCDRPCGLADRTRSRTVKKAPACGGKQCPFLEETIPCTDNKPCDKDCEVDMWGAWGVCSQSCGGGFQESKRNILTPLVGVNGTCPLTVRTRACPAVECPSDCVVSEWGAWSDCNVKCGGGFRRRSRLVVKPSIAGGQSCPYLDEFDICNEGECSRDCEMTTWTPWTACSATCDTTGNSAGYQERFRYVLVKPVGSGKLCDAEADKRKCNEHRCPIDCELDSWSSWTDCDQPCGNGYQHRERGIKTHSQFGGKQCDVLSQTKTCFKDRCPENCTVGSWGPWSSCSVSCGEGTRFRTREVITPPHNAAACPSTTEVLPCKPRECPVDCVITKWSPWSPCNADGFRRRQRKVLGRPQFGGKVCPDCLIEKDDCIPLSVPEECLVQPCENEVKIVNAY